MTIRSWLPRRLPIFTSDNAKGPWGAGDGNDDGADKGGDAGPRNPWTLPPGGRSRGGNRPSALDEFIRRARGGGFGGGGGAGGGLPGGPRGRSLWLIGIIIIVLAWLGFTSIHTIGPQSRGVTTLFGRYVDTLGPGVHVTFPAPINHVITIDVQNIRNEDFPDGGNGENLMLTGDQNLIDLAYSVRWTVSNPQDFEFQIADPRSTVRATAESAMREVVANTTLDNAMGPGRTEIEQRVQDRMQQILDSYRAGVRIQSVTIKQADPPAAVNDAFKEVTAAQQDAVTMKNQAQAYAQQMIAHAQGEAAAFDRVYAQYKLAPEVTRRRMYYETMEDVLARTNKTIVETPGTLPYLKVPNAESMPPPPSDSDSSGTAPSDGGGQ